MKFQQLKSLILQLLTRYRNFIIYCIIGCTGAVLDFLIFAGLTRVAGINHHAANCIGVSCGIINNFFLNRAFNFKQKDKTWLRLLSFYAVGLTGLLLSEALLFLMIDRGKINMLLAKFLTIFVVTLTQYTLNKTISFRKNQR